MTTTIDRTAGPMQGRPLVFGDHFFAHSFRTHDYGGLMNPLLMVDHFWMRRDTFGRHRHQGISALSYVFPDSATGHHNRDSMGNELPIQPGDLHWFGAGRGAEHHEFPEEEGAVVHALQIFVDLPLAMKRAAPFALHVSAAEVPKVDRDGSRTLVVAGEFGGAKSPLQAPQPFTFLDGYLEPGARVDIPLPTGWGSWLYAVDGSIRFDGTLLPKATSVAMRREGQVLAVTSDSGGHFVVMAGLIQNE